MSTNASSIPPPEASRLNFALVSANLSRVPTWQRTSFDSSEGEGGFTAKTISGVAESKAPMAIVKVEHFPAVDSFSSPKCKERDFPYKADNE
eukprot:CAMPEP_0177604188 /NCGR_PEP_ID=MMETSP0419_2-20121207/15976_1 /TAXON_ID=582737 /ORGANISM="Tetraselmis sp., Strain GSL018" /LENGTH=91 /DNA_ID=CAMNT_0019098137 /DNA_START=421 /DNA_END=696 /DNA_ORIENTATION=-